ncbi:MAG TPA: GNAT family N-acetyltransferase [Nitrososphaerales archaeon]|nr:GNAT family N-acetyltransferase [Nitrososphaerales archaeon]
MDFRIRPARAEDKEPLMSFIKDVWGGHDYIPEVWDDWLGDPTGKMFVVEVGGVPVGMNHLKFLEDGSAWFEGIRVHPDYRGRGLASMLGENSMKIARDRGVDIFRLTSGSHNKIAHRQIARVKFAEVARFSAYEPRGKVRSKPTIDTPKITAKEFSQVMSQIGRTKEYQLGRGVFWHNWTATSLSPKVVRELLAEGAVWRNGEAVAVAREGGEGNRRWEELCFIGGPEGDAWMLLISLFGRNAGVTNRWVFLPQKSPLIHKLRTEGFVRNFSMILFERRAANG